MNLKNLTIKTKIYFTFVLLTFFIILSYLSIDHFFSLNKAKKIALEKGIYITKKKEEMLKAFLNSSVYNLKYINESKQFNNFINNPDNNSKIRLNNYFKDIASFENKYMQIRYLDQNGIEKIKVKKDSINKKPKIVKEKDLQDKSDRYYFIKAKELKKGKVWFSNIDLNMENKKVEMPYKPTLRAVTPIYKNNKFSGALVINYFMEGFIKNISNSPLYDVVISNKKGFTMLHYDKNKNWGYYKKEKYTLKEEFKDYYKDILTKELMKNEKLISRNFNVPLEDGLIMILQLKNEYIEQHKIEKLKAMLTTSSFVIILSLITSFILVNIIQRVLLDKDKMIYEQNKLASMGQMIENIAHQWRQPLAEINSIIYTMDHEINKEKIDKIKITKELDEMETITDYLSQTINDFKEFLAIDKPKKVFYINDSINKTIKIIKGSFEYHNINIIVSLNENIKINNYHNLLEQSLLSILNNAKDVLIENHTQNAWVKIELKSAYDHFEIIIEDNAGGIKTEPLEEIFEPYFTTKHQSKGTGLGLYIAKMMIEDGMDGRIEAENTNNGAKFKIILKGESGE